MLWFFQVLEWQHVSIVRWSIVDNPVRCLLWRLADVTFWPWHTSSHTENVKDLYCFVFLQLSANLNIPTVEPINYYHLWDRQKVVWRGLFLKFNYM